MQADLYVAVRRREGRLLDDDVVARLPDTDPAMPLAPEWRLRRQSSERLLRRLAAASRPLRIVDAGCGNGWLAHRLSRLDGSVVAAFDINEVELEQGRRVFGAATNLTFHSGDVEAATLPLPEPDVIVAASVLQYVADPAALLRRWRGLLGRGGAIHVLDTPLYTAAGIAAARERSLAHYTELGMPEMAAAYHHHPWAILDGLQARIRSRPDSWRARARSRLGLSQSPFPWIEIPAAAP